MKPLEEHLAEYVLGLYRDKGEKEIGRYVRQCGAMWESKYGKLIADKALKIARSRWNDKKGKKA